MAYANYMRKRQQQGVSGRLTHQYDSDGIRYEIELWLEAAEADTGYQGCEVIEDLKIVSLLIDGKWQRIDRDNKQVATLADLMTEAELARLDDQKYFSRVLADAMHSMDYDGPDPDEERERAMDLFDGLGAALRPVMRVAGGAL